jgi:hypothetical protein
MQHVDGISLLGIAAIILALTAGYFLMRRSQSRDKVDVSSIEGTSSTDQERKDGTV